MTTVVNICHGWMCPLVTKCQKSDFNVPTPLVGWGRHYQSPQIGEHCPDYVPLKMRKWGEGPDAGDD